MSKKVLNKVRGAFQALGIELKKFHCYYEFEYDHVMALLQIDEEEQSISFVTFVVDPSGGMDELTLKTALSIVSNSHEYYGGGWNDGFPFFISPAYYLGDIKKVSTEWLQEKLKAFVEAYLFLEANIQLLCDTSLWGPDMEEDGNHMNGEGD